MKQLLLLMAVVGLATTGCAHNRVLGPQARRGNSAGLQIANSRYSPQSRLPRGFQEQEREIELAGFRSSGGCDDGCCGDCCSVDAECGCPGDTCCGDCCDATGCCEGNCDDGCCAAGCANCPSASCSSGRCGGGCSACGGRGCGLCQRLAGRVASGFCPHAGGYPANYNYNPSPPTGQVAYPYYTVRGPRDFLRNNPPSIGPY